MNDNELNRLTEGEDTAVSIQWILLHLVEHEALHVDQDALLK